jgi:plasmid stabilization system protein ParE
MDDLRFHPAARAEFIEAIVYHEQQRPGYGEKLVTEVEGLLERAARFPASGSPLPGYPPELDVHAWRLQTFRYSLIIADVKGERIVCAVAHERRRPGYWANRMR